ncbi:Antiporter family protein [Elusimicrobium minutum Pei191]|uniref:Antiporter family protein n=1 Tax=Elusimicrobium minutum (strain Pei191) TaxID=445932 RepID=B2KDV1_ELUMP|nr:Na+/H+ antiporter NhaC family protein [Elusimicrobium minutum]ACC98697.1 Antiporter family protein [Elusimicrobium minutum Pei191]
MEKFKLNTYMLVFGILIFTAILSWIVPPGQFDRVEKGSKTLTVAGSYTRVERSGQGLTDVLLAPIKGFQACSDIIIFILVIGAVFTIIERTGTVNVIIQNISYFFSQNQHLKHFFIPVCMFAFSLCGALFGMEEETIIFVPIFIPLALSLGYDTIVGMTVPFLGAFAGFCSAFVNPFTVGIAQTIAELDIYSGMGYRIIVWLIATSVVTFYVSRYGAKVLKTPSASFTYHMDLEKRAQLKIVNDIEVGKPKIRGRHKAVIMLFIAGITAVIFGVTFYKWYIDEIAALFLFLGILCAMFGKMGVTETTDAIIDGMKNMISVCLLITLARSIIIVATDGNILDTFLHWMALAIGHLPKYLAAQAMFIFQTILNFFIASGSGQAVLTMPIMAPLADLVGISRQTAVLAYQFGEGWGNPIIPTAPVTVAVLAIAGISWTKWLKWFWKLEVILIIMSMILLIPPFFIGW